MQMRSRARAAASVLVAAGLVVTALPARAANTLTGLQVKGGQVEIDTSSPPNFTTFTMTNPPRLVVDVADCTFEGDTGEVTVNKYGITTIKTQAYGSGSSAIARVLIGFKKDTDTNISTAGSAIIIAPAGAGATAVAAATPAPAPKPSATEAAPPPTPPPAAAAPAPIAEAAPPPPAPPMAAAPVAATAAAPELQAPPPAPAMAAAPTPPPETAPAEPAPLAAAAPMAPPPSEAPPPPPPQENAPLRLAASTGDQQMPPAPAPAPAAARSAQAAPEASLTPPPASTGIAVHVSRRTKRLSLVGMRFSASGPSVFVRTNEPVNYQVQDDGNGVRITIENTRIVHHNDTRPLDAQYFDTPVWVVRAKQEKHNVVVHIQLKSSAPYQAVQQSNEVQLNFTHG
jgi:colicin import membrane protein